MPQLDPIDIDLLAALADDPRVSVASLAQRFHLSRATISARLSRLREDKVFRSYDSAIAPAALGFPLVAIIQLRLRQSEATRVISEISRIPEVLQALRVSGRADLDIRIACRDARHLFDVDARLRAIEGVERTEATLVSSEAIPYRVGGLIQMAKRSR